MSTPSASLPGAIPIVPFGLGLAGLIPFWGLAVGLALHGAFSLDPHALDLALATYAAIILSFLGGIRWGISLGRSGQGANFVLSIVPSLVAWACLLAPEPWRLALLGVVALVLGPIDVGLVHAGLAPRWFGRLRLILSTGAGVALLLGAAALRYATLKLVAARANAYKRRSREGNGFAAGDLAGRPDGHQERRRRAEPGEGRRKVAARGGAPR